MPAITSLPSDECERLLRSGVFGRIALTTPDGPEILPVNYVVDDDAIWVRTHPGGVLARYANHARLVFEVDLVDHERWHGWSVVARGTGEHLVAGGAEGVHAPSRLPHPWAAGVRNDLIRLRWEGLTGRKIGEAWDCLAASPVRPVSS